jgi:hypothetical protein
MSEKADGSQLGENKVFQNLLAKMDDDADEAEKQWKSQGGNPGFAGFPADFLKQYKADGRQHIRTRGAFNAEWNKIVFGRGGDPTKLLSVYDAYSASLELLWESNARFKALIEVEVAKRCAAWLATLMALAKLGRGLELARALKDLKAGDPDAARKLWERYFRRPVSRTRAASCR